MKASERFRLNLATAMESQGLTQRVLAERAETSGPYVNRVLRGETVPGLDQTEKLAKAVGFPISALLDAPEIFSESVLTSVT